ncbi:hypothetical protein [Fibrobacter sp. UWT3]|uniref:hypothetical protein n=1 Tax=Fibrobacter sp. UWT3 TaxID=1896225 RepID=UPI000BE30DD0|nr:hypothetical protein [Fibrobacter sp. UWT3]
MKKRFYLIATLASFLLIGCGEEKEAKSQAILSANAYIKLQDMLVAEKGHLASSSEIENVAKEMGSPTSEMIPPKENEFFAFEMKSVGFAILSKVEIDGCPAQTVWAISCDVKDGMAKCVADDGEYSGILNLKNRNEKVPEACEKVFGEKFRSLGK